MIYVLALLAMAISVCCLLSGERYTLAACAIGLAGAVALWGMFHGNGVGGDKG